MGRLRPRAVRVAARKCGRCTEVSRLCRLNHRPLGNKESCDPERDGSRLGSTASASRALHSPCTYGACFFQVIVVTRTLYSEAFDCRLALDRRRATRALNPFVYRLPSIFAPSCSVARA